MKTLILKSIKKAVLYTQVFMFVAACSQMKNSAMKNDHTQYYYDQIQIKENKEKLFLLLIKPKYVELLNEFLKQKNIDHRHIVNDYTIKFHELYNFGQLTLMDLRKLFNKGNLDLYKMLYPQCFVPETSEIKEDYYDILPIEVTRYLKLQDDNFFFTKGVLDELRKSISNKFRLNDSGMKLIELPSKESNMPSGKFFLVRDPLHAVFLQKLLYNQLKCGIIYFSKGRINKHYYINKSR